MIDFDRIDKDLHINEFLRDQTDYKAFRLFQWYGTDIPREAILRLQRKVKLLADNIETNGKAKPFTGIHFSKFDEAIQFCHELIERGDPKMKTYEDCARMAGIGTQAFIKKYKSIHPTITL